jgi:hypothetical protein
MFVQIAPHVKVFLTKEQLAFVEKYQFIESFTDKNLDPQDAHTARVLGDKAIFVRMQYALNRRIRFVKDGTKK